MPSGNNMQIGNQILRDLSRRFSDIESQFDLLQWADSQFLEKDLNLVLYLTTLAQALKVLANAKRSGIFTYIDGRLIDFEPTYNNDSGGLPLTQMEAVPQMPAGELMATEESLQAGRCRLFLRILSKEAPEIVICLEDAYFGRNAAGFYEEGFLAAAKMLARRTAALIDSFILNSRREQTRKITREFLSSRYSALDGIEAAGPGRTLSPGTSKIDNRWLAIADLFAGYFPTWAPFAFDHPPLVQILTVEQIPAEYVVLRATRGKLDVNVAYKPLKVQNTISGLLLEKENSLGHQEFLLVNPTESPFIDRYASYLYDTTPQSELVIPIRDPDAQDKIVALINLEHPVAGAFSKYHVQLALDASNLVSPFILHLLAQQEKEISDQKLFRYIIMRLIRRLSDTFLHKINNQIPVIKSSLSELAQSKEELFTGSQLEDFNNIRNGVGELSNLSKHFLSNISGFILFGPIHLSDMVMAAVNDFDVEKLFKSEAIEIKVADIGSRIIVFGSALIHENIYNIIKNSIDEFRRNRRKPATVLADRAEKIAHIKISVSSETLVDLRGRDASYEFVRLSINDDAGGIRQGHEDKVLQRGHTTKRDTGGTGFGLSAAAEYMASIGGLLSLENHPGVGLTVHLNFPVYTPAYHDILAVRLNVPVEGADK